MLDPSPVARPCVRTKQLCVAVSTADLERLRQLAIERGVSRRQLVRAHLLPYLQAIASEGLAVPERVRTPPARPVRNVCFPIDGELAWQLSLQAARAKISLRQLCYTLLAPLLAPESAG